MQSERSNGKSGQNRDVRRCRLLLNNYPTIIFINDYRKITSDDRDEYTGGAKEDKPLDIVGPVFSPHGEAKRVTYQATMPGNDRLIPCFGRPIARKPAQGDTMLKLVTVLSASLVLLTPCLEASEWSRFRGPNGSGAADATELPVAFGDGLNMAWKVAAASGKSSPVLTEDHVFLTAHQGDERLVLAFDRETGRPLWRRSIDKDRGEFRNDLNDPAAPSPVSDGETSTHSSPRLAWFPTDRTAIGAGWPL